MLPTKKQKSNNRFLSIKSPAKRDFAGLFYLLRSTVKISCQKNSPEVGAIQSHQWQATMPQISCRFKRKCASAGKNPATP
jgi:hypothetical protein